MFVLESIFCGEKTIEKKFPTNDAAFDAMKTEFMGITGKSEFEIAEMLSGDVCPDCEFSTYAAAAYASRSYWNICPEELIV